MYVSLTTSFGLMKIFGDSCTSNVADVVASMLDPEGFSQFSADDENSADLSENALAMVIKYFFWQRRNPRILYF